ncbi:MAG TPA: NAD(P)-dependent alcohol dehydrogenase [Verrucomicrobiae bacterium]|nr:NAD(P)-dependent alcohol dehydrogenase [Verrucomicrobiae bacterium]
MSAKFKAYAAAGKGQPLTPFEFDPGPLGPEQVEIKVSHCGICHSDLSMIGNEWGFSTYPFVPGHEVVGTIVAAGDQVKRVKVGDRVGLGWYSKSCLFCPQCLAGDHNLCSTIEQTMIGRYGGFADRVRCHWLWASPLPAAIETVKAGPLFCGGITVFNPIVQCGVQPTQRVGVIGIGGLGHLALQFLNKWGCEVVAFTSSESKRQDALRFGAHHTISSRDTGQMQKLTGSLDFILVTANADLDWPAILNTLAPKGRLHVVGAVPAPISVPVFALLAGQKAISGSPLGSPATTAKMLAFCARQGIAPTIERFPMSRVNDALEHLRAGKARYRIVLENDIE